MTQPGLPPRGQLAKNDDGLPPQGLTLEDLWREIQRVREEIDDHRNAYYAHGSYTPND
jgi:hypothetical protein